MAIEDIKRELLAENQSRIAAIRKQGEDEIKKLEQELKQKGEEYRQQKERVYAQEKSQLEVKELSEVTLQGKRMVQEKKKEILNKAITLAQQKLENLDAKQRKQIIEHLLADIQKEISVGLIYANDDDAKLLKGYKVKSAPLVGGIIAENEDGTIRVDYSLETMLHHASQEKLAELSKLLFASPVKGN
ncbi:hypothetical protein HYW21_08775 [Candidatus Woesearchaeota archaeon]|nr:hypothetical protein [Candidatus Woesearchaeota archaeon]